MIAARPPGHQQVGQVGQGRVQMFQLAIHRDPERLEDPRGRVDRPHLPGMLLRTISASRAVVVIGSTRRSSTILRAI